ncbi:amidohydrolase family protein [Bradyrhizobium sp. LB11.1]|uniref:amidohydrolase family protein n=1 Tax=Bradyrhizobium sp. LB11.1 TaxID=3156326 RepID=UPI00339448AD
MTSDDALFTGAKLADGHLYDIAVSKGRIISLSVAGAARVYGATIIDVAGARVVPGFVEAHIHLDTSFYGDEWRPHKPCTSGFDVHERVAFQAQNLAEAAPLEVRARNQLELCLSRGSTQMRSHVMVDGTVGLRHLEPFWACEKLIKTRSIFSSSPFRKTGFLRPRYSGTARCGDRGRRRSRRRHRPGHLGSRR